MATRVSLPWSAIGEACSTLFGWTCAMFSVCFTAFVLGYWVGHREIMSWERTTGALAMVPLLWLGSPGMTFTYLWTAIAWYAPIHNESTKPRIAAAITTGLCWFFSVEAIAYRAGQSKIFSF